MNNKVTEINPQATLHTMKLHEQLDIEGACVTRVPGGWLYVALETYQDQTIALPPVFVPYSEEFKVLQ